MENIILSNNSFIEKNLRGPSTQKMGIMDHLDVLRWHLVRITIAILLCSIAMFVYIDWIFDHIVYAPAKSSFVSYRMLCSLGHSLNIGDALCMPPVNIQLQGNTISGPFMSAITIALTAGILMAFPYICWELWKFIRPALSAKESKTITGSLGWVSLCFFSGAAFGYFLLAPFTFNFLGNYSLGKLGAYAYLPTLDDYINTLTSIILGCAIGFQLPVVAYVLSKIGILTPLLLRKYRKYAYVVILVLAAVITPSPDWTSQAIVTVPLILLYEISILLSKKVANSKLKEALAD
ncbi:MAG: Sec-independent protein translocase TatC [Ferruginibacter sp.]|nr:Sec-independent protein translocase TatC [Ferruginibacter sp.]